MRGLGPFLIFLHRPHDRFEDFHRVGVEMISRHGFGYIESPPLERDPLVFDWDDQDARLLGTTFD